MPEVYSGSSLNRRHKLLAAFTGTLLAASLSGCGGPTTEAESAKLRACQTDGDLYPWTKAASAQPIEITDALVALANEKALRLHARVLKVGGSLDLPRYTYITEASATKERLRLNFPNPSDFGERHIHINKRSETMDIAIGTVACTANGNIYPNGVVESIDRYLDETKSIGDS